MWRSKYLYQSGKFVEHGFTSYNIPADEYENFPDHFTYYLARITLYIVHHDDVRDNPFFPDGCAATSLVVPPETRGIDSCFLGK
jgi:hypothetical protein